MGLNIRIMDSINARPVDPGMVLNWREGIDVTLEDLIKERVRLEVERASDLATGLPPDHPLVAWKHAPEGTATLERKIEHMQRTALLGFENNAFFVVVDGKQVEDLRAPLRLTPISTVRFVRLLQLVGG
ncbi:hypothetical protein C9427_33415 [Mesorhizobium helmanticense]|uniref:Uncharacterized protein n=2 Tax=Mesorhizobium helmanticense TaxID=1776423 RepID=A0A2T4IKI9_9HYPH|nr:hypothetical protein C9427_33415 [Mesorhizobium helmanticense]